METPPLAPLPPVLSTQEVATLLRLSTRSVLEMVKAGTLMAHRASGRRRYHFLTEEVLAAVSGGAGGGAATLDPGKPSAPGPARRDAPVDPCDVWGAAPSRTKNDWPGRCLQRWLDFAVSAGLTPAPAPHRQARDHRAVGVVDVDGLAYQVLAGPRQRVHCLDAEGEPAWELIDSVWVEPLT